MTHISRPAHRVRHIVQKCLSSPPLFEEARQNANVRHLLSDRELWGQRPLPTWSLCACMIHRVIRPSVWGPALYEAHRPATHLTEGGAPCRAKLEMATSTKNAKNGKSTKNASLSLSLPVSSFVSTIAIAFWHHSKLFSMSLS